MTTTTPAEALAFHLVSAHGDPEAIGRTFDGNKKLHRSPGQHPHKAGFITVPTAEHLEEILEKAESGSYGFTRNQLPNGMPKDHIWMLNECGEIPRNGNH